jgi:hypothetical protein
MNEKEKDNTITISQGTTGSKNSWTKEYIEDFGKAIELKECLNFVGDNVFVHQPVYAAADDNIFQLANNNVAQIIGAVSYDNDKVDGTE